MMSDIFKFLQKQKNPEQYKNNVFLNKLQKIITPQNPVVSGDAVHFKHSGNAGDIIYALPAMLAIARGKPIHLHLNINQKGNYGKNIHPLGNLMLTEKTVGLLSPLLLAQPGIAVCDVYTGQHIDADLDLFRQYPFLLDRGNIARWYFLIFGEYYPLHTAWLQVKPMDGLADTIIIARSQRYHAPGIDYSFLKKYQNLFFIGMPEEYSEMKQMIPDLVYKPVNDFLEMASIIGGCKFFIGNQSFPFSLAEAMKTKRLLEWYFQSPNVTVAGNNGFDFCLQHNFEKLVFKMVAGQ